MISPLLQQLAAAVHAGASCMIYSVLSKDMHATTVMSPEVTCMHTRTHAHTHIHSDKILMRLDLLYDYNLSITFSPVVIQGGDQLHCEEG